MSVIYSIYSQDIQTPTCVFPHNWCGILRLMSSRSKVLEMKNISLIFLWLQILFEHKGSHNPIVVLPTDLTQIDYRNETLVQT